jgi:hypothetical protein
VAKVVLARSARKALRFLQHLIPELMDDLVRGLARIRAGVETALHHPHSDLLGQALREFDALESRPRDLLGDHQLVEIDHGKRLAELAAGDLEVVSKKMTSTSRTTSGAMFC